MPLKPPAVKQLLAGVVALLAGVISPAWSQGESQTRMSDIFFLDLGIVIEPVTGKEKYSRLIESPSEEVKFRINKIKSGAVYMATSKEMMGTLDRINLRIASLEQSFHAQMDRLQRENKELRGILTDMRNAQPTVLAVIENNREPKSAKLEKTPPVNREQPAADFTETAPINRPLPDSRPPATVPKFDQAGYMSGVFAYQREDFTTALEHFYKLDIIGVSQRTQANILYWTADAHQHMAQYDEALQLLNRILAMGKTGRRDDALVQKGLLYRKLGQEDLALLAFEKLVADHPTSEYVKLARMELKKAEMVP